MNLPWLIKPPDQTVEIERGHKPGVLWLPPVQVTPPVLAIHFDRPNRLIKDHWDA